MTLHTTPIHHNKPRHPERPLLGLAALLLSSVAAPALAQPIQISGPSPFALCVADNVAGQPGINYPGTEIEPWIDANPANPLNLIAGWQQDRWSNGGARGNVSAHSLNGGATWTSVEVPGTTLCTGGIYKRASDPWVSIAPNGTAYFFSLAFDPDFPNGTIGANAMLVNRSFDGGATWEATPTALVAEGPGQVLHDKNSLTADYTNADFAYAAWDRLTDFTVPPDPDAPARPASKHAIKAKTNNGDGISAARERRRQLIARGGGGSPQGFPAFFEGPAYFARTTDGGDTWEAAKEIFDPGPNAQTINNLVAVQPDGDVYVFFTHIYFSGQLQIEFLRSTNKGESFGPKQLAQKIHSFGAITPDMHQPIRDASILFDVAVDRNNGNLYLVWQDTRFGGREQVVFSMSTNGGSSWSAPVQINQTPRAGSNSLRRQAIVPSIEVADNGRLTVTYYDFRNDVDGPVELTDHWAVFCDPATSNCRTKQAWGDELRLTGDSFDFAKAPVARGLFLGDYMGLVASGNRVYPAFGIVDGSNLTSIVTRPINVAPADPVITAARRR